MLKERGLLIQDEKQALKELHIISYFRLANYLRPMELDKTIHQFKTNSYFEFTAIQSIEIALRTQSGCVKIETLYHFVIQSVAKDLGNTHFMYSRFFASL